MSAAPAAAPALPQGAADPLAQLRDIHMPAPVTWWPLAPGWWLLGGIALIALGAVVFVLVRRWRQRRYRRVALRRLDALYAQWQQHGDRNEFLQNLNRLLKQTALHAFPAQRVAALHGAAWLRFLDSTLPQPQFADPATQSLAEPYRPHDDASLQADALRGATAYWLRRHRC